jgi:anion-transporting  ArsA/GET3 family ATPase
LTLTQALDGRAIVVCCGPGGVGKTTSAAAIAVEEARRGRRAVVVTVDPARRLADALGVEGLSGEPHLIDSKGRWDGELWALMLDTKSTFDRLVYKYAAHTGQAESILSNRFYRNIAGALSGTQEYMAMEQLYELHDEGRFDVIVVDTPPTRNALDFIDAPRRLTRFLDNRIFRLLMLPARASLKILNAAAQPFLRTVARVVGVQVVQDAIAFFQAFEGMEDGFRDRAQRVLELLSDPGTAFVLVASPRRDAVDEASFFVTKLAEADIPIDALVVNRMHPRFTDVSTAELEGRAASLEGTTLGSLYRNLTDLARMSDAEDAHLGDLVDQVTPAPAVRVPLLASDVHDVEGLEEVARYVFAR